MHCRVEKKVEEKKVYDWKKSVKKGEKKEPVEEPKPEKVQLKKPKVIEKPKEEAKAGVQLKPTPPKAPKEDEPKQDIKLKPVPPKEKEAAPKVMKDCRDNNDVFTLDNDNSLGMITFSSENLFIKIIHQISKYIWG